jgi:acetyl-CoA synthetase (ADP-forming)
LEQDAETVAKEYGITVSRSGLATTEKEALTLSKKLGFPLVMKIVSRDILHKSDIGGVKAGVKSNGEVRRAFREIIANARKANRKASISGILVQSMAQTGHEFVVGGTRDPQFGPTVMFGLGGIYVELFKDVSFRLAPLDQGEALSMMDEIKSSRLLTGFRGSKPLDKTSAAKVIMAVGDIMNDHPEIDSVDINPLFIYPKGVCAVDVRIILHSQQPSVSTLRK